MNYKIIIGLLMCMVLIGVAQATTYTSQYPIISPNFVKATTTYDGGGAYPYYATDPSKPLSGSFDNGWYSLDGALRLNNRFHIDLGGLNITRRVYYENTHNNGGSTTRGVQAFTVWGTNNATAFTNLNYGDDTSWTQLTTSTSDMIQHNLVDGSDPQNFTVDNSVAYRYYSFKFATNFGDGTYTGIRRIVLQTEDGYSPVSTPVASFASTNISVATNSTARGWEGVAPFTMQLTNTSTNPPFTSYVWNATNTTGNNVAYTFNSTTFYAPIHTFTYPGNYSIQLNVTGTYGSNISIQKTYINVSAGSTAQTPIAISSLYRAAIQAGWNTWYNDTSLNTPTARCWTFGDGTFAATANGSKTYYKRGIFNVSSNVSNSAGFNISYNIIRVV